MVREGDVLAGKYRIEKVLGKGGIGFVVAARHLQLDERVAIKLLLPESLVHPELVARFLREGKAAVKIRSEHVARIHDVGNLENGAPYLVMEYLDGVDLSAHVERLHSLPVAEAVDYVLQACVAIAEAHSLGIVHRDLKPANLFLTRRADGSACIKVIDFGISKMSQAGDMTGKGITKTSSPIGSPLYMSPEQMTAAKSVGPPTDIWALGIILFELLTGARAFDGESIAHLYINIATQPPARITPLRPDVPPALEQVYLRCLEKQPAARFGNVAELAVALAPFAPQAALSVERIQRTLGHAKPPASETLPLSGAATQMLAPPALSSSPAVPSQPALSAAPAPPFSTPPLQTGPNAARIPSAAPPAATAGAWGSTGVPTIPMNRGARALLVVAAAAAVLLGIVVIGVYKFYPRGAGPAATAASAPSAQEPPPPASTSVPEAVASATPSATASTARKLPHHPAPVASPAAAAPAPAPAPAPAQPTLPSATPASPKPNCNPSYTVDAQGEKHFKPECFTNKK